MMRCQYEGDTVKKFFYDKIFNKKLISLVIPIAFQQLVLSIVGASDAIMLNLISQDKMSAVSLATQVTFVENLFLAAMTIGLSTLAAQYWGKKDTIAVEKIFAYVTKVTFFVSLMFCLVALFLPEFLMELLTNEPELVKDGAEYLRLASPSYLFMGIAQIYLCILKNSGKTAKSTIIGSVCLIGDMIMNIIFIPGLFGLPKLEVAGAALSTSIAFALALVWCIIETTKKDSVRLRIHNIIHTDKKLRNDFWKYTTPVLGNEIVWGVGFTMFSVIMGHLGSDAVAANAVANIVKNLVCCLCIGLGSGGGIMVGNELGAGHLKKAKAYGDILCKLSVLGGILSGIVLLLLSPIVLSVADLNANATEYLKWMLVICSYYMIGKSVNSTTIAGIFCAGGDSKFGFICDSIVMWGIVVPLGFISAFVLKLPVITVYFIISLDEFCKLPAVYLNYKKYKWVKDLTIKEER